MFTQERAPWQTFTYSKSRIETLKIKSEMCLKLTIKAPGQPSTLFIVNFEHFHSFFFCVLLLTWSPTLSIYKRWIKILLQLLTDVQKS